MISRHFTLEEANALIPTLEPVMRDLRTFSGRLREAGAEFQQFTTRLSQNGHGHGWSGLSPEFKEVREEVEQRLLYLDGIGVLVKDIEHGVLDFPTRLEGRDVLLCWRVGEKEIAFWHEVEGGYAGRRPL